MNDRYSFTESNTNATELSPLLNAAGRRGEEVPMRPRPRQPRWRTTTGAVVLFMLGMMLAPTIIRINDSIIYGSISFISKIRTPDVAAPTTTTMATLTADFPLAHVISWFLKRFQLRSMDATEDTINQQGSLVVMDRPGFFGYSNLSALALSSSTTTPPTLVHNVSYNHRSLILNDEPLLLLGGSIHPVRHTPATWAAALDEAVAFGLNLVTVYVMWAAHQPTASSALDWRLPGSALVCQTKGDSSTHSDDKSCWTLATALQAAAQRRLWVHVRIGPYVCAEYNYGGLPEWIAVTNNTNKTNNHTMSMRRPNRPWLDAMQGFVRNVTSYLSHHQLWAHQGGNILMAQIENELQGDIDPETEDIMWINEDGKFVDYPTNRRADLQDYANWCGDLARQEEPHVLWTMCNGLSATNTIETFNGVDGSPWLDHNGSNGRVQKDYPALFTEFEGGFQIWGDDPEDPSDYFWGQTARDYAARALRWFARGGTHLNYYMFGGGYNRDRMAAAGITNMYASDAPLCSSGLRRQPKFDHLQLLHSLLQDYADLLLSSPTRAWPERVKMQTENNTWVEAPSALALFRYEQATQSLFIVENMQNQSVKARWTVSSGETLEVDLNPWSVSLFDGPNLRMDSSDIDPKAKMYRRYIRQIYLPSPIKARQFSIPSVCTRGVVGEHPVEQTQLMVQSGVSSDYAWYATEWNQATSMSLVKLVVETQLSNAFVVFLDGQRVSANETHAHFEGSTTLEFWLSAHLSVGHHRLVLLSESLGYDNVIGVWGVSAAPKTKGLTGQVWLASPAGHQSLVTPGQTWCSCASLLGCHSANSSPYVDSSQDTTTAVYQTVWRFASPQLNQGERLFVRVRTGRGHFSLNGVDMGRFWNITRQHSGQYSQANYLLPVDYLRADQENELRMENVLGEPQEDVILLATHIAPGSPLDFRDMEDEVGFPRACF